MQNIGLAACISVNCEECKQKVNIENEYTKYKGTSYNGKKCGNENCSWHATNVRLVAGTLAAGMGPNDVATLFSFLELPILQSFSKTQHPRIESLIGKSLRGVADKSMDKALDKEVEKTLKYKNINHYNWKESDNHTGLTMSYDMGWSKRSSGHRYDSLSGHGFLVGAHSRKIVLAQVTSKYCKLCSSAEAKGEQVETHECPRNYKGSSKAMEADGALSLVTKLDRKTDSKVFVESLVTDDDSSIRAILSHPSKGKQKGQLSEHIPQPRFLADPSHRARVVDSKIFALARLRTELSPCEKIDAYRFKKYYSYMLKEARHLTLEQLIVKCKAVLEHLFDNHTYCNPKWCKPSRIAKKRNKKLPRPPLAQTAGP